MILRPASIFRGDCSVYVLSKWPGRPAITKTCETLSLSTQSETCKWGGNREMNKKV
jgi:hypothetical protein